MYAHQSLPVAPFATSSFPMNALRSTPQPALNINKDSIETVFEFFDLLKRKDVLNGISSNVWAQVQTDVLDYGYDLNSLHNISKEEWRNSYKLMKNG